MCIQERGWALERCWRHLRPLLPAWPPKILGLCTGCCFWVGVDPSPLLPQPRCGDISSLVSASQDQMEEDTWAARNEGWQREERDDGREWSKQWSKVWGESKV